MKIGAILATVLLAVGAAMTVFWISRQETTSSEPATATDTSSEPVPSKVGPHPKVVLPESVHQFGVMKMGDSDKHIFIVRNEGKAPLKLGKPQTTCQCTVSEAARDAILPGEEGTITLEWKPTSVTEAFEKGAVIRTNDPAMPEIRLNVVGQVKNLLDTLPPSPWDVGTVSGEREIEFTGLITSALLDEFKITAIESRNPLLTAEATPATVEELASAKMKSAYKIHLKLSPGMPVGKFSEQLVIKTDVDDKELSEIEIDVVGTRHGPIQILPTPGVTWNPDALAIDLGRFPAAEGKSGTISLFVSGVPADKVFEFESVETSEPYVKLELKRDEEFKAENRQRFELTFIIPPGSPVATHRSKGSIKVNVKTNHPEAREMKFFVQSISTP